MNEIARRLLNLEKSRPVPLLVVCKNKIGEVITVTVSECIKNGYDVISTQGNNLVDASKLLDYIAGPECAIN